MNKRVLFVLVLLGLTIFSCSSDRLKSGREQLEGQIEENELVYNFVYLEGMPCVIWSWRPALRTSMSGLSCDWSKWKEGQ